MEGIVKMLCSFSLLFSILTLTSGVGEVNGEGGLLRPIYTIRFLLTIVACDFCSAHCSRHEKIAYDFHDINLPVATIVLGF